LQATATWNLAQPFNRLDFLFGVDGVADEPKKSLT
jgi:hypothetical protein